MLIIWPLQPSVGFTMPATVSLPLGGAALTRHFRDPRRNRANNIGFAALLLVLVAATLLI